MEWYLQPQIISNPAIIAIPTHSVSDMAWTLLTVKGKPVSENPPCLCDKSNQATAISKTGH
jgi:hypothetical protein